MTRNRTFVAIALASCLSVAPATACAQGIVPPGSGGIFRNFPQPNINANQNNNTQILQQLQTQQQQLFNQRALQQSGIGVQNGQNVVSTTGHPTFFNDLGGYYNSGLNSGGGGIGTGTTGQPFFNRNATLNTNPFGGSGVNLFFGIGR